MRSVPSIWRVFEGICLGSDPKRQEEPDFLASELPKSTGTGPNPPPNPSKPLQTEGTQGGRFWSEPCHDPANPQFLFFFPVWSEKLSSSARFFRTRGKFSLQTGQNSLLWCENFPAVRLFVALVESFPNTVDTFRFWKAQP